jgi:orotate phosphoribosyltransferase-like protein
MAGLRINIKELRQIIRLKKEGISNRKVADMLHLSRNARCDEIISLSEEFDNGESSLLELQKLKTE